MTKQKRKYLYVTPLFYSIGDASEDIFFANRKASLNKKTLRIIKPFQWTQILKYKICNEELFELENNNDLNVHKCCEYQIFNIYINIIFFFKRSISLIFGKYFKIKMK
jgi:hypothetical protein